MPVERLPGLQERSPSSSAPSASCLIQIDSAESQKTQIRSAVNRQTDNSEIKGWPAYLPMAGRWSLGGGLQSRTSPQMKDPPHEKGTFRLGRPVPKDQRDHEVRMQTARGLFRHAGTRGSKLQKDLRAPGSFQGVYIGLASRSVDTEARCIVTGSLLEDLSGSWKSDKVVDLASFCSLSLTRCQPIHHIHPVVAKTQMSAYVHPVVATTPDVSLYIIYILLL